MYNNLLNLVVAKLKSNSATSFSMSRGSSDITYPSSQYSDSSVYNGILYIGSGQWTYSATISRTQANLAPISSNTFSVYSDLYGTTKATYPSIVIISMGMSGKTLYRYLDTGSKLVVSFTGIATQKSSCQVWVQY